LEGGVGVIILEKNPVQWLGEGGGERGGCKKKSMLEYRKTRLAVYVQQMDGR
jgi:hypothetical protein